MTAIQQLKALRSDTLERLQNNSDYLLLTSLNLIIGDLEKIDKANRVRPAPVPHRYRRVPANRPANVSVMSRSEIDASFEELTATVNGDHRPSLFDIPSTRNPVVIVR